MGLDQETLAGQMDDYDGDDFKSGKVRSPSKASTRIPSKISVLSAASYDSEASARPSSRPGSAGRLQDNGKHVVEDRAATRRHSTVEHTERFTRGGSKESRASCPATHDERVTRGGSKESRASCPAALDGYGAPTKKPSAAMAALADDVFGGGRRSMLDMSPRTARRNKIREHRMSLDGRPDFLGATSAEVIQRKLAGYMGDINIDDDPALCGFRIGDDVTSEDGPDADGPWKFMGVGTIAEPGAGCTVQKGFVQVDFVKYKESFNIRACNLWNLTEPSRSGKHMRPVEKSEAQVFHAEQIIKNRKTKQQSAFAPKELARLNDQAGIPSTEPTTFTFRDGLQAAGLQEGDIVGSTMNGSARFEIIGTVVKGGVQPGDVLVRMKGLGIRSFKAIYLSKIESSHDTEAAAKKASHVDTRTRSKHQLTMDEAYERGEEFVEDEFKKGANRFAKTAGAPASREKRVQILGDAEHSFASGEFVRVCKACSNPVWQQLGIGMVRGPGEREGTVKVQFDSGSEIWTLYFSDLELLSKDELRTDRAFRIPDEALIKKRGGHL